MEELAPAAAKKLADDWAVGGKLWEAKREKDRVARTLLSKLTKKRAEEAANVERIEAVDTRLKSVESMIEGLSEQIKKLGSSGTSWQAARTCACTWPDSGVMDEWRGRLMSGVLQNGAPRRGRRVC